MYNVFHLYVRPPVSQNPEIALVGYHETQLNCMFESFGEKLH